MLGLGGSGRRRTEQAPLTAAAAKTAFRLGSGHFDDDCDGNDVAFVCSVSWSARDAALREGVVSLPSSQTSPLTPPAESLMKLPVLTHLLVRHLIHTERNQ